MELSIIAVGNIFIDLESGKKCKVKEIFYLPKKTAAIIVFKFEDESEIRVEGEALKNIADRFAKVSGF
jgi:hypothetical protein